MATEILTIDEFKNFLQSYESVEYKFMEDCDTEAVSDVNDHIWYNEHPWRKYEGYEDGDILETGYGIKRFNYKNGFWLEYMECYEYLIDDGDQNVYHYDMTGRGDDEFRLNDNFEFEVVDEDDDSLDRYEIEVIIEDTLDLTVDYSGLKQKKLEEY